MGKRRGAQGKGVRRGGRRVGRKNRDAKARRKRVSRGKW